MTKNDYLKRAIELVNGGSVQGFNAAPIKQAANTDLETFKEFLKNISEQGYDPDAYDITVETFGQELTDIAMLLFRENKDTQNKLRLNLEEQRIKGGMADDTSLEDIAKKFNVTVTSLKKQLKIGIEVELEHTKNRTTAKDIAMDHLTEMPDYYTRLDKMETIAMKHWDKKEVKETRVIVKDLLRENLKRTSVINLLNDFGMLASLNLSQVTKMGRDEAATKELVTMMQNLRKPIINGQTYFDLIKDVNTIINQPKMLSAVLGKIREFLIYIEPRIQQFVVDGDHKTNWLGKIANLKSIYRSVIQ